MNGKFHTHSSQKWGHIMFVCLFSWRYNPLWLYFQSPVVGFSLLFFEVTWSHTATCHIFFKLILLFVILWIHVIGDNVHFVLFIHRFGLLFAFFPTRSLSFMDCCTHLSGVLFSPPSQIFCYFFVLLLFRVMQVILFLVMYCYPSRTLR
jgi:hypothetical protein